MIPRRFAGSQNMREPVSCVSAGRATPEGFRQATKPLLPIPLTLVGTGVGLVDIYLAAAPGDGVDVLPVAILDKTSGADRRARPAGVLLPDVDGERCEATPDAHACQW